MHYAIAHQNFHYDYLVTTPRKKSLKYSLIRVNDGLMLVRLGKLEYAVEPGESIWLPFDCLCSLTFVPQTIIQRVDFSVRLDASFPNKAGLIKQSELSQALVDRLGKETENSTITPELLSLLKHESTRFKPSLRNTRLSQQISQWQPNQPSPLPKTIQLVLLIREASKRLLSGVKEAQVVETLFNDNHDEYQQLRSLIAGQ